MTNKCTSIAGHFDGHAKALKQYMRHCPMQHVHDYTGSHYMPPLGNYLLHIAPVAARATANKTIITNVPTLLGVLMAVTVQRYNTVCIDQWRRFMAFLKATKRRHWASACSDSINWTHQRRLFLTFHREKGHKVKEWPLITIGVWHIKLMRST